MNIRQLIKIADDAYGSAAGSPNLLLQFLDADEKVLSPRQSREVPEYDGLARFLVTELYETFDPQATDEVQLAEAARVMNTVREQVAAVCKAFEAA